MKTTLMLFVLALGLAALFAGCEDNPNLGAGLVTNPKVEGVVTDATSKLVLQNARVFLAIGQTIDSVVTGADGIFRFQVDLPGVSSAAVQLTVSKTGYRGASFSFNVNEGGTYTQDVSLSRDTTTGVPRDSLGSGLLAHSIALIAVSAREIAVYGVGGLESSIMLWEVRDSLGFPIDIDHRDTVFFSMTGTPVFGGAYVSPASALTNVSGRVATTVNSGTVSGVLQFTATLHRDSDGKTITSTPVLITVNAGLPDSLHFSIGPHQFNFAAYDWIGRTNSVTVQVGDKYSNPVKTGTAVYFNTTGGVVTASGFTDATSHATVTLYSGNPDPRDPSLSPPSLFGNGTGYAWVRAYTLGEDSKSINDSVLVLFSGTSQISASRYFVDIDTGTCQDVAIKVSDRFGNPLSPGTIIKTEVTFSPPEGTNWSVIASGLPSDPLDDFLFRGPGITDYTLHICDGTPGGTPQRMPFVVKISVISSNGNTFTTISGNIVPR